jgi:hypothetical protein
MNCEQMDAVLFTGGELSQEARAHLATCASCRALAGVLGDNVEYAVDAATLQRAQAHIPRDLAPVRPLASSAAFAALFLLLAAAVAAAFAWLKGFYGIRALTPVQDALIFLALAALLGLAAFALAGDMRPGARTVRGIVIFALAFSVMELVFLAVFSDYAMGQFVHQGMGCFKMGMTCAAATALLVWLGVRRGYIVAPVSTGATLGALAGLAGLTTLELHCPLLLLPHIAIWHGGVLVAASALGAAAGWAARWKRA